MAVKYSRFPNSLSINVWNIKFYRTKYYSIFVKYDIFVIFWRLKIYRIQSCFFLRHALIATSRRLIRALRRYFKSITLCPYGESGYCPWPCPTTSCQGPRSCPIDCEPYGEIDGLIYQETDEKRVEETEECLEDGSLSNHSDETIGSFEIVGKLEFLTVNDYYVSEGSVDMEKDRHTDT